MRAARKMTRSPIIIVLQQVIPHPSGMETDQLFTTQHDLAKVQIESIGRRQFFCGSNGATSLRKGRKHCGKRKKCWFPAFSPSPTMFSKAFSLRVVKSRHGQIKG